MIRLFIAAFALIAAAGAAQAQGVDRFQFLQLKKQVEDMSTELNRMRNAISGGNLQQRFAALEDEISRLTGQIERLEFAVRKQEEDSKRRLDDLEYRIIELEGGDPSILFQQDEPEQQGSVAPSQPQSQTANVQSGQTLGVLTSPISGQSDFDQGVAAAKAGDATTAQSLLQRFITANPGSPLIGDANFWLGESYYATGDFREAARRYVDVADLYPGAATAPQSLVKLGVTLSLLGQTDAACQTLAEVGARYPNAQAAQDARDEARRAGCS